MNALPPRLPVELAGLRDWGAPNGSLAMRMMPLFVAGLFMIAALSLAAGRFGADRAIAELAREAQTTASLHSSILQTELGKYRSVPYILGHDGEVRQALATRDPAQLRDLDRKLEVVSQETGATVLYVVDAKAKGLSGSNWRTHKPFCQGPPLDIALKLHRAAGCHDRVYYTEAMRAGSAEMFALGRSDNRPGVYFSHAVDDGPQRLGVVVAKVQFDILEQHWRAVGDPTFVTDANGVVLITSIPEWRLRTLAPLEAEARRRILAARQFGDAPLDPLPAQGFDHPIGTADLIEASLPGQAHKRFVETTTRLEPEGWTLHTLKPAGRRLDSARWTAGGLTFVSGLLALCLIFLATDRHERRRTEDLRAAAAREELEIRVVERTRDLSGANQRLTAEMDERRRVQARLHKLQDELVQANRLATLGQIAAGVAHEINQPLAAIRIYAENAADFVERSQPGPAQTNLRLIGELTGRIAVITEELKAFSRRATGQMKPVLVTEAIDGALLLVSHRMVHEGVHLARSGERPGLSVLAERVRLEQVLVNLLQNSLDALRGRPDPEIQLVVGVQRRQVTITVTDNGSGLSEEAMQNLFMPFVTTKAHGLGLGLVISRDIMAEFGGDLSAGALGPGATFMLTLRKPKGGEGAV
jgi:two-component system C4-dicarboxylate transport sensor histidine kinase DctB